jgi:uncharacterized DUF497 family protein
MENIFDVVDGFEWDIHNIDKNWIKHSVTFQECEQVFFNKPVLIADDIKHSENEKRFFILGRSDIDKKLFIVFTIRRNKIRVISAKRFMMSKLKKIPKFKSIAEEKEFWKKNDSTKYIDWSESKTITFANLKPSTKTISLRLPEHLIEGLKNMANKRDVPYQSLIKIILMEGINKEYSKNIPLSE